MEDIKEKIGLVWDKKINKARIRWWQSPTIIRYCNYLICGKYLDGWNAGGIELLKVKSNGKVYEKAISIGCGLGTKEMILLEEGVVNHFSCYELSKTRIEMAKKEAERRKLSDRIEFHLGDFFESIENKPNNFDFVFWDNSLHHMMNTKYAIENSKKILKSKGIFFCNDFIGSSRFQWTDLELVIMNGVRQSIPDNLFLTSRGEKIPRWIQKPDLQWMIDTDPSEAADSENIIPSIKKIFPKALIINLGGLIYHTVLNDILVNIDENSDYLWSLLQLDGELSRYGFGQYAFILSQKE